MARSRHGRSGGRPSSTDAGLPTWAQRHLDEAGDTAVIPVTPAPSGRRHHRVAVPAGGLRGWGLAIVSVAAAAGAVPLAVSSVANNHTGDPLPKVDTYTAGKPGPLPAGPGVAGGIRSGAAAPQRDQATAGVLDAPPEPPVAHAPIIPRHAAPVPVPAAVVRTTPAAVAPAAPRTAASKTPTSTTQGRSATTSPKTPKPPTSSPRPPSTQSDGGDGGGSQQSGGGLIGNTVGGLTHTVSGVLGAL
jgi:outer membrane biosynthesis protein TonB